MRPTSDDPEAQPAAPPVEAAPAEVKAALDQVSPNARATPEEPHGHAKLALNLIALAALVGTTWLVERSVIRVPTAWGERVHRALLAGVIVVLLATIAHLVIAHGIARVRDPVARFDLQRIARLLTGIVMLLVVLHVVVANWYAAAVSVGLISLVLGLALQAPLSSFFAWIYILVRRPYRVGDRIRIGEAMGDVIDVSYLDTTLWEFGGQHLSTDHPSGRVIKFPNAQVLDTAVYNYSWPLFPYVWNEITLHVGYQSDLELVASVMRAAAEEEMGQTMSERVHAYRSLLAKTPVDHLQVREHPVVNFRVDQNTWIDAIVRYLVHPKEAGATKTRLIRKMLSRLNEHPERVLFPKGDMR